MWTLLDTLRPLSYTSFIYGHSRKQFSLNEQGINNTNRKNRMATALKNLNDYKNDSFADVSDKKVGIVVAEWHSEITDVLCAGAIDTLLKHGIQRENIFRNTVPGSFELPLGAQFLALQPEIDAVICIGVVIKGDTKHDDYINHAVANGLTSVALKFNKPVSFGLVTTNNLEQALDRAGGKHGNKGVEAAAAVIGMLSF